MPKSKRSDRRRRDANQRKSQARSVTVPRFKDVSFRQLIGFFEAARLGSFAAAAEFLGLSRPSVWMQVRAVEREFKTELLEKDGRRLRLTADGRRLLELVRPLVNGFSSVKSEFNSPERSCQERHHLRIITTPSLIANELRQPISELMRRDPLLTVHVSDRAPDTALQPLMDGDVDLTIAGFMHPPTKVARVQMEPITSYPLTLICPANHPFATASKVDFKALAQSRLILSPSHTNPRVMFEAFLAKIGVVHPLQVVFEAHLASYLADSVEMGLGICITAVSPLLRQRLLAQRATKNKIHIRDLSPWMGAESVYCLWRTDRPESPWQEEFRRLIKATATTWP